MPVRVFDENDTLQEYPRAATTHPATPEVLAAAGLVEDMARVGLVLSSNSGIGPAARRWRNSILSLNLQVVKAPPIDTLEARKKFDGAGRIIEQSTRDAISMLLNALFDLTISTTLPQRLNSFRHPLP